MKQTLLLSLSLLLLSPATASAQLVGGTASRPPADRRPPLKPESFARAVFTLPETDYDQRVRGIPADRAPTVLYGPDGNGNLLALSEDGVISLESDGTNRLRTPFARLEQAGVDEEARRGPAAIDRDGHLYMVDSEGNVVRIPKLTSEAPSIFVTRAELETLSKEVAEPKINDLLVARQALWIAANGPAGLVRKPLSGGALSQLYDPFADVDAARQGTNDLGVMAMAKEAGQDDVVFAMSWNVGSGAQTRIGGIDGEDKLFGVVPGRGEPEIVEGGALARGMAALGEGAWLVSRDDGTVIWFNYRPDVNREALPLTGAFEVLSALVDDLDRDSMEAYALAAGCDGRAYLMTNAGTVTLRALSERPDPGDILVVIPRDHEILRITPFGEPAIFRDSSSVNQPTSIARSSTDGTLIVTAEGSRRLLRFTTEAAELPAIGDDTMLSQPFAVGVDGEGRVYFLDRVLKPLDTDPIEVRLQTDLPGLARFSEDGVEREVLYQFDSATSLSALGVGADGTVVVSAFGEDESGNFSGWLWRFGPDWALESSGEPEMLVSDLELPQALMISSDGAVWIGDTGQNEEGMIYRLAPGSTELELILPQPGEENLVRDPRDFAETDDGRILIIDAAADIYPGSRRTGAIFSIKPDGSDLRVILDHPQLPPSTEGTGIVFIPGDRPETCQQTPEFEIPPPPAPPTDEDDGFFGCALGLGGHGASGIGLSLLLLPLFVSRFRRVWRP